LCCGAASIHCRLLGQLTFGFGPIDICSLHGGHVESWNDGHPQSWFTDVIEDGTGTVDHGLRFEAADPRGTLDGESIANGTNYYRNDQNATMLFFHDHALGITRLNVYAGLAGLYIIEDDFKTTKFKDAGLDYVLGNVARDIPLALSDKTFAMSEEAADRARLVFPYGTSDAGGSGVPAFSILPEMFGYIMTVNGRIWPKLDVSPNGIYLFRFLDACDRCDRELFHLATFASS